MWAMSVQVLPGNYSVYNPDNPDFPVISTFRHEDTGQSLPTVGLLVCTIR